MKCRHPSGVVPTFTCRSSSRLDFLSICLTTLAFILFATQLTQRYHRCSWFRCQPRDKAGSGGGPSEGLLCSPVIARHHWRGHWEFTWIPCTRALLSVENGATNQTIVSSATQTRILELLLAFTNLILYHHTDVSVAWPNTAIRYTTDLLCGVRIDI